MILNCNWNYKPIKPRQPLSTWSQWTSIPSKYKALQWCMPRNPWKRNRSQDTTSCTQTLTFGSLNRNQMTYTSNFDHSMILLHHLPLSFVGDFSHLKRLNFTSKITLTSLWMNKSSLTVININIFQLNINISN